MRPLHEISHIEIAAEAAEVAASATATCRRQEARGAEAEAARNGVRVDSWRLRARVGIEGWDAHAGAAGACGRLRALRALRALLGRVSAASRAGGCMPIVCAKASYHAAVIV